MAPAPTTAEISARLVPLLSQMKGADAAIGTAVPRSDARSAVLPDLMPGSSSPPGGREEITVLSAGEAGDVGGAPSSAFTGPDRRMPKLNP
jgi:hypothetical protein